MGKTILSRTDVLAHLGFYEQDIFEVFLGSFKCQWDTVRKISFEIIRLFPREVSFLTPDYKNSKINLPAKNVLLLR